MATDDFPATATGQTAPPPTTSETNLTEEAVQQPSSVTDSPWFWLGMLVVLSITVRYMPVPNQAVAYIAAVVTLALHVLGVVQFTAQATRRRMAAGNWVLWFFLCLVLWASSQFIMRPFLQHILITQPGARNPWSAWSLIGAVNYTLRPLFLLGATVCGGSLVARLINSPNMIGPICAIIALIDVWGVLFRGPVSQIMEKAPAVANKVMADLPVVGQATGAAARFIIPELRVGPGDYLFLGLLFAALHRNNMNWRGAVRWVVPLMTLVLLISQFQDMPGLLPIGLAVAIPNWRYFEYTRDEKFALLYAGLFVVVLTAAIYFGITSYMPAAPHAANHAANAVPTK